MARLSFFPGFHSLVSRGQRAGMKNGPEPSIPKITRPEVGGILPPERLLEKLDEGAKRPAIWVCGPGGAGKTHLLSSYIESRGLSSIWYQVDHGDTDVASFFYYLGTAGTCLEKNRKGSMPILTSGHSMGLSGFTHRFFEELFERMVKPGLLVLDNLQEVPDSALVVRVVLEGLSRMPAGLNLAVISRRDPPPAFYRLISSRKLSVVGWDELRMTREEFVHAARVLGGGDLDEDKAVELYTRLEGWIAGLVLALEQGRHNGVLPSSFPGGDLKITLNYFVGEIWDRARSETRQFLLETSFLPTLTPVMAEELTGIEGSESILSDLCDHNLFTFRLSQQPDRYRYHSLFREFLREQARKAISKKRYSDLLQKATSVLLKDGQYRAAAELHLESGDFEGLCQIVHQRAQHLLRTGRSETLKGWLSALPLEYLSKDPWLMYWSGICAAAGNQLEARMYLARSHEAFSRMEDLDGMWMSWASLVSDLVYYWGDVQEIRVCLDRFNQIHGKYGGFPSDEVEKQVLPAVLYAFLHAKPYPREMSPWIERTRALLKSTRDIGQSWRLFGPLLNHLIRIGCMQEAQTYFSLLLPKMDDPELTPFFRIWNRSLTSLFQFMSGETRAGVETVDEGLLEAERTGMRGLDGILSTRAAHCALSDNDLDSARKYLLRCHGDLDPGNMLHRTHLLYINGWLAHCQGDRDRAYHLMTECYKTSLETGSPFFTTLARLGMAHVMVEQGMIAEARQHLAEVIRQARNMESRHILHQAYAAVAWLYMNTGDGTRMSRSLERFCHVGRVNRLFNFPMWRPEIMSRLSAAALDAEIDPEYVRQLIRKRSLVPASAGNGSEKWPWPFKIYTLGRFEILRDDEPVRFTGKIQQKPLDLFKALISYGGRRVNVEKIMDILWPESEGDAAQRAFDITLHRLRKMIGNGKAILLKDGKLSLDPEQCWVDVWLFERLAGAAESQASCTEPSEILRALEVFRGIFLPNDESKAWTATLRERTWSRYQRLVEKAGSELESRGEGEQAVDLYLKALERNPKAESIYRRLMVSYESRGQKSEALAVYRRCQKILSAATGVGPDPDTQALYKRLNSFHSA